MGEVGRVREREHCTAPAFPGLPGLRHRSRPRSTGATAQLHHSPPPTAHPPAMTRHALAFALTTLAAAALVAAQAPAAAPAAAAPAPAAPTGLALPKLAYPLETLEPAISARTVDVHYNTHVKVCFIGLDPCSTAAPGSRARAQAVGDVRPRPHPPARSPFPSPRRITQS